MGLDMYLCTNSRPLAKVIRDKANDDAGVIEDKNIYEVQKSINNSAFHRGQVAYWRKANAIHQWFVDNCQGGEDDCRLAYVSYESLSELLNDVKSVLDNHELAEELLPTQEGFFFGSTAYDDYYWEDLEETKEQLEFIFSNLNIIEGKYGDRHLVHPDEPDWYVDFYYQSSW